MLQPQYSLFNGNIATWTTKTRDDVNTVGQLSTSGMVMGEQYRYDQLNRLTSSAFYRSSATGGSLQATQDYATAYSYDPNGNLQTLTRNGRASLGQLAMDQLRYQYYDGSNQLKRVDDAVANQPYYDDIKQTTASTDAQYGYDALGNLTSETGSSGSKSIEWNVYGKIARVDQSNGTLTSFGYDAQGQRIHKAFTTDNGRNVRHVYYVRDAQGNVLAVYEQNQQTGPGGTYGALALTEQPVYGSSRLGVRKLAVSPTGVATESFRRVVGQKQYELSDHLGNVRALVSDIKRPDDAVAGTYKPDLLAYYGYYPFGMLQPGRSAPANGTLAGGYRYGYNGKEKDNNGELGLTTYDYGFRIYNPGIGKFLSVDPLTKQYPWYTPYQFAGNTPIGAIDLDGAEEKIVTSTTGKATAAAVTVTRATELAKDADAIAHLKRALDMMKGPSWLSRAAPALGAGALFVAIMLRPVNSEQNDRDQGTLEGLRKTQKSSWTRYMELHERRESGETLSVTEESEYINLTGLGLSPYIEKIKANAQNYGGINFESFLHSILPGGSPGFYLERDFDGKYINSNGKETWFEAKSGKYWEKVVGTTAGFQKFRSTIGQQQSIAKKNGAEFEVFSNSFIPQVVKSFLDSRDIKYKELSPTK